MGFTLKIGTREQVINGIAKMTSGKLIKKQLKRNKKGIVVSRKLSNYAKKKNILGKYRKMLLKKIGGNPENNIPNPKRKSTRKSAYRNSTPTNKPIPISDYYGNENKFKLEHNRKLRHNINPKLALSNEFESDLKHTPIITYPSTINKFGENNILRNHMDLIIKYYTYIDKTTTSLIKRGKSQKIRKIRLNINKYKKKILYTQLNNLIFILIGINALYQIIIAYRLYTIFIKHIKKENFAILFGPIKSLDSIINKIKRRSENDGSHNIYLFSKFKDIIRSSVILREKDYTNTIKDILKNINIENNYATNTKNIKFLKKGYKILMHGNYINSKNTYTNVKKEELLELNLKNGKFFKIFNNSKYKNIINIKKRNIEKLEKGEELEETNEILYGTKNYDISSIDYLKIKEIKFSLLNKKNINSLYVDTKIIFYIFYTINRKNGTGINSNYKITSELQIQTFEMNEKKKDGHVIYNYIRSMDNRNRNFKLLNFLNYVIYFDELINMLNIIDADFLNLVIFLEENNIKHDIEKSSGNIINDIENAKKNKIIILLKKYLIYIGYTMTLFNETHLQEKETLIKIKLKEMEKNNDDDLNDLYLKYIDIIEKFTLKTIINHHKLYLF